MRLKAVLIITAIAFIITAANFGSSLILTRNTLNKIVSEGIFKADDIEKIIDKQETDLLSLDILFFIAVIAAAVLGSVYITKPIDMIRLDSILRRWVIKKEYEADNEDIAEISGMTEIRKSNFMLNIFKNIIIDGININNALEFFAGNEEVLLKVLDSYKINTRQLIDKLINSIENALVKIKNNNKKPATAAPDEKVLQELREACAQYDAGRVCWLTTTRQILP